jgi:hypothetical protein
VLYTCGREQYCQWLRLRLGEGEVGDLISIVWSIGVLDPHPSPERDAFLLPHTSLLASALTAPSPASFTTSDLCDLLWAFASLYGGRDRHEFAHFKMDGTAKMFQRSHPLRTILQDDGQKSFVESAPHGQISLVERCNVEVLDLVRRSTRAISTKITHKVISEMHMLPPPITPHQAICIICSASCSILRRTRLLMHENAVDVNRTCIRAYCISDSSFCFRLV